MNIELAGASGVGKTTVLNHISENLYESMNVASGEVLLKLLHEKEQEVGSLHYNALADDGAVFCRDNFVSEYLYRIKKMSGKDTQKLNLVKFIAKHRKDFLVRSELNIEHLLVDEGLVHASFPLSQFSLNLASDVAFFFESIPLPSVVIQLHAKPEKILKRIRERGKVVNSYLYADDTLLLQRLGRVEHYLSLMENMLFRRGCRVQHVDANGPVKEWSQTLLEIVKSEIAGQTAASFSLLPVNIDGLSVSETDLGLDFTLPEDSYQH